MRITFLMPSDNLTGGNRVVAIYAQQLAARGHEVLVVSCAQDRLGLLDTARSIFKQEWSRLRQHHTSQPGHIAQSGVPHKVLERPRAISAADVPDADIVIATWWETAVWMHGMPASKGRKVHLIQGYEVWFGSHITAQVHAALQLPNVKIAISSDLKQTIEEKLGDLGITVVPNAVDLAQFTAPARTRQPSPTVGFVYAVAAIKGADICAQACELARRVIPDLKVVAFGADQPTPVVPLPTGTDYFYRPEQTALKDIYGRCDVWLFGSRLDSFGLPILEAMACRTPVIAVPIGAAPELLGDGTGFLVDKESPASMAQAIIEVLRLPADGWLQRSDRAYKKAHSYSWEDATTHLLAAFQKRGFALSRGHGEELVQAGEILDTDPASGGVRL
jgi:glycosyltransferase involved in cell wall biosynthesis